MPAYRVALVATLLACLSTRRAAAAAAPTVEADGPDLTLSSGDGGDVSLASPDGVVTLTQLSQALADIAELKAEQKDFKEKLQECREGMDGLTEEVGANALKLEQIDTISFDVKSNAKLVADLTTAFAALKEVHSVESDGVQSELATIAEKLNKVVESLDNDEPQIPTCTAIGKENVDTNLKIHQTVLTTDHVVGFRLHLACKDGYATEEGLTELACFPSGNYCNSATFPAASCTEPDPFPSCKKCPDECTTCLPNGLGCTSCKVGFTFVNGACMKSTNCKGYADAGALEQPVSDYDSLGLPLKLSDGRETKLGKCLLDEDGRVYEVFPCTALLKDGQRSCTATNLQTDANTCSDAGYMLFTFRNPAHYKLVFKAYGGQAMSRYIKTTSVALKQGMSHPSGRPYSKCAMNSAEGSGECATDWVVPDGGDWFLKAAPHSEPNGDAKAGWFLQLHNFEANEVGTFNDWRSSISTGPLYFCIPRDD